MRNVLIVSYYFPPVNKIASRRFGQMVEYLEENGWKPWILTIRSSGDLPVRINEEQIVRISGNNKPQDIYNQKISFASRLKSLISQMGFKPITIDQTSFNWVKEVKGNFNNISDVLPELDAVISTFGPGAAFELGSFFKSKYNIPLILDFRDMAALKNGKKNILARIFDRVVEKKYVRKSSGLTTISPTLGSLLKENYRIKTKVIFNGWDRLVVRETEGYKKYFYYAGRVYPHQVESFKLFLSALVKISIGITLRIRSISIKMVDDELKRIVKEMNLDNRVEFLEPCSSDQAVEESREAFANLVFEDLEKRSVWPKGTLTGKFLQLISLSPPIVSIARSDNDMGAILKETQRGKLCSTTEDILDFFKDLNDNYDKYDLKLEKIEKYSKKEQAQQLCSFLDEVIVSDNL